MKIVPFIICLILSVSQAYSQCLNDAADSYPYDLQFKSYESKTVGGFLKLTLNLKAKKDFDFSDFKGMESENNFFKASCTGIPKGKLRKDDIYCTYITISYNISKLPYYPVKVTAKFLHTEESGEKVDYWRSCYVYFTPYNTVEIWDEKDFYNIKREWLKGSLTTNDRKYVPRKSIPKSNIPANYVPKEDEEYDMTFIEGLAYAVPMLYPDFPGYNTSDSSGRRATREGCGAGRKRFKGQIGNTRIFTWHIPDGGAAPVQIWLKGARVEIWRDNAIFDDHIGTTYTDDNGFFNYVFTSCGSNDKNHINIYLKIKRIDSEQRIRVKNSGDWNNQIIIMIGNQRLNYDANNHLDLNFGDGNREIALAGDQGGLTFTWIKWCKQFTQNETAVALWRTCAVKIEDENGTAHYSPGTRNIHLDRNAMMREATVMHEFGHFVMHHYHVKDLNYPGKKVHRLDVNNTHPLQTYKEGFADGYSFIMDEMTRSATDNESGRGRFGPAHPRVSIVDNLLNPYVAEKVFGCIMLDLWDGPNNYAKYQNNSPLAFDDFGNDNFEMSFALIMSPLTGPSTQSDIVQYYNYIMNVYNANCESKAAIRDIWYYNFSNTNFNQNDWRILNTDEIAQASVMIT